MNQHIVTNTGLFPRFDRRVNRLLRRGWKFADGVNVFDGGWKTLLIAHLVRESPEPGLVRRWLDFLLMR